MRWGFYHFCAQYGSSCKNIYFWPHSHSFAFSFYLFTFSMQHEITRYRCRKKMTPRKGKLHELPYTKIVKSWTNYLSLILLSIDLLWSPSPPPSSPVEPPRNSSPRSFSDLVPLPPRHHTHHQAGPRGQIRETAFLKAFLLVWHEKSACWVKSNVAWSYITFEWI